MRCDRSVGPLLLGPGLQQWQTIGWARQHEAIYLPLYVSLRRRGNDRQSRCIGAGSNRRSITKNIVILASEAPISRRSFNDPFSAAGQPNRDKSRVWETTKGRLAMVSGRAARLYNYRLFLSSALGAGEVSGHF